MSVNQPLRYQNTIKSFSHTIDKSYRQWIDAYVDYHDGRHPILMGSNELKSFMLYLDFKLHLPPVAMRHAFEALKFLYTEVFGTTIPRFEELLWA